MNANGSLAVSKLAALALAAALAIPHAWQVSTTDSGPIRVAAEKKKDHRPKKTPDGRPKASEGEPMSEEDQKAFEGIFDDVNAEPEAPPCRDTKDDC